MNKKLKIIIPLTAIVIMLALFATGTWAGHNTVYPDKSAVDSFLAKDKTTDATNLVEMAIKVHPDWFVDITQLNLESGESINCPTFYYKADTHTGYQGYYTYNGEEVEFSCAGKPVTVGGENKGNLKSTKFIYSYKPGDQTDVPYTQELKPVTVNKEEIDSSTCTDGSCNVRSGNEGKVNCTKCVCECTTGDNEQNKRTDNSNNGNGWWRNGNDQNKRTNNLNNNNNYNNNNDNNNYNNNRWNNGNAPKIMRENYQGDTDSERMQGRTTEETTDRKASERMTQDIIKEEVEENISNLSYDARYKIGVKLASDSMTVNEFIEYMDKYFPESNFKA